MAQAYEWRCECGSLAGVLRNVESTAANRLVCYCDDCQAFAHYLDADAVVLDEQGGTDIVQMSPANVVITAGEEHLACVRLSEGGTHRWYAGCCRTPIGNTAGFGLPFVGLIHRALLPARDATALFGAIRGRVQTRFARGEIADGGSGFTLSTLVRFISIVLRAKLRGAQRSSPFFDARTRATTVAPTVLGEAERQALYARVGAA